MISKINERFAFKKINFYLFRHFSKNVNKSYLNYRIVFLSTAILSIGGCMMMPWSSAFALNNLRITQQLLPIIFMVSGLVLY